MVFVGLVKGEWKGILIVINSYLLFNYLVEIISNQN